MAPTLQVKQPLEFEVYDSAAGQPCHTNGEVSSITPTGVVVRFRRLAVIPSCWTVGTEAVLRYGDEHGVHSAATKVLEILRAPVVAVVLPADLRFMTDQRRKFLRVPARFSVAVTIVDSGTPDKIGRTDENAVTEDLSAGGMRFLTSLSLQIGDVLDATIKVTSVRKLGHEIFHLPASVVRLCGANAPGTASHSVACQFFFIGNSEQSRLVRLVQKLQPRF